MSKLSLRTIAQIWRKNASQVIYDFLFLRYVECTEFMKQYEGCVERVKAKGHGHCTGQYFDFLLCVDKCVGPELFKKTK